MALEKRARAREAPMWWHDAPKTRALEALRATGGDVEQAMRASGASRRTVYRWRAAAGLTERTRNSGRGGAGRLEYATPRARRLILGTIEASTDRMDELTPNQLVELIANTMDVYIANRPRPQESGGDFEVVIRKGKAT
jgi:hypothetical protein